MEIVSTMHLQCQNWTMKEHSSYDAMAFMKMQVQIEESIDRFKGTIYVGMLYRDM